MKVDSHHHFWRYDQSEYGWISEDMQILRRDFLPQDLGRETASTDVDGVVSVQARQTLTETCDLLSMARRHSFILGVVGWVPLRDPSVGATLEELAGDPWLKGCRHVLQDEPDDDYMLAPAFNDGIRAVTAAKLVYDILIFERHLPQTLQLVDRHPDQVFVLDHIGKPLIRDGSFDAWHAGIRELARRPNVRCKISGMVTEAAWDAWTEDQLLPYVDAVFAAFGPQRLMFGSDWPVCLVATTYRRWFAFVEDYCGRLSDAERERVLGGTAVEVYRLQPTAEM